MTKQRSDRKSGMFSKSVVTKTNVRLVFFLSIGCGMLALFRMNFVALGSLELENAQRPGMEDFRKRIPLDSQNAEQHQQQETASRQTQFESQSQSHSQVKAVPIKNMGITEETAILETKAIHIPPLHERVTDPV